MHCALATLYARCKASSSIASTPHKLNQCTPERPLLLRDRVGGLRRACAVLLCTASAHGHMAMFCAACLYGMRHSTLVSPRNHSPTDAAQHASCIGERATLIPHPVSAISSQRAEVSPRVQARTMQTAKRRVRTRARAHILTYSEPPELMSAPARPAHHVPIQRLLTVATWTCDGHVELDLPHDIQLLGQTITRRKRKLCAPGSTPASRWRAAGGC